MRLGLVLTAAIAAVLLPIICHASEGEGHGYDFVEAGWSWLDARHDGDGFAANVSVSVSEHLFFYGNGTFVNFRHGAGSADSLRGGLGFHTSLNDSWDFVIRGAAQHIDEGRKSCGVQGCMIRIGALSEKTNPSGVSAAATSSCGNGSWRWRSDGVFIQRCVFN